MSQNNSPKESVIRLMTRLSDEQGAINLSQGFTNNSVIFEMLWGAISASLAGTNEGISNFNQVSLKAIAKSLNISDSEFMNLSFHDLLKLIQGKEDVYNQYSYPFGIQELRDEIANYTKRFYGYYPDPNKEITVTTGATEGMYMVLVSICKPGDEVLIIEPFHSMYGEQTKFANVGTQYIALKQDLNTGEWIFDMHEFEKLCKDSKIKAFILNTPHNPTGKIFTLEEQKQIAKICRENGVFIISDEIYEHITYEGKKNYSISTMDYATDITFVVNSISKTGNATGWRVGWIIAPEKYSNIIRAIHDTVVMQAPTPLQKGAVELLKMPDEFYKGLPAKYAKRGKMLVDALTAKGFKVFMPEGSYYLLADFSEVKKISGLSALDAAIYLIEKVGVATVPGDDFYYENKGGKTILRFAFCRNEKAISDAADRIKGM